MTRNGTTDSNFGSHSHDKAIVSIAEGSEGIKEERGRTHGAHTHTHAEDFHCIVHTHTFKGDHTVEHS